MSLDIARRLAAIMCPACEGFMGSGTNSLQCLSCNAQYPCEDGIPLLFWPHESKRPRADVTETVRAFYEENPFPNYDDLDSRWSLMEKAKRGVFARLLDEQVPYRSRILEAGCGTGQLSNFLGMISGRAVFGTDICLNSLRLGQKFKERHQIGNVVFLQMNLFRPVFRRESFDLVICNGVLHSTSDPFGGFQSLAKLVKKGGFILIGLYNTYGRIPTDIRRLIFRLSGDRFKFLDPHLRDRSVGDAKKHAWFMDQYKHPHESTHTIGEVLGWFDRSGFEFISSVPKCTAFGPLSPDEKLFEAKPRGTRVDRFFVQLGMLLSGGKEGGFFVMIGRKQG